MALGLSPRLFMNKNTLFDISLADGSSYQSSPGETTTATVRTKRRERERKREEKRGENTETLSSQSARDLEKRFFSLSLVINDASTNKRNLVEISIGRRNEISPAQTSNGCSRQSSSGHTRDHRVQRIDRHAFLRSASVWQFLGLSQS